MGTARYASINALICRKQSHRDDFESIVYISMHFLKGRCLGKAESCKRWRKYSKILEKKKSTSIKELCAGVPREMETFVSYVKKYAFKNKRDNWLFLWWEKEKQNIGKNNIIYKNNYHIE